VATHGSGLLVSRRKVMSSNRFREIGFFAKISLAFWAVAVAVMIVATKYEISEERIMNGFALFLFTACPFGMFLERSRRCWKEVSFWYLCAGLLVVHCSVLALILIRTHSRFDIRFFFCIPVEYLLFRICRDCLFRVHSKAV